LSDTLYVGETDGNVGTKSGRHEAILSTYDMSSMRHVYTHVFKE